ncbi:MAG: ribulose-phosphate 3-epimerase [Candidatus Dependentiae bacterium]|nr:ribulose-phosphate 3-epimerase [Candidatus Dependentiae bacterium]
MAYIFPSLISSDLLHLEKTIKNLSPHSAGYHIDIMDNHFVPNLTWGLPFIAAISTVATKPLWIHLMVDNPETWVTTMQIPQGSIISFHLEAVADSKKIYALIAAIQKKKWRASIAISPDTDIEKLFPFLSKPDTNTEKPPSLLPKNADTDTEKLSPFLHTIDHVLMMGVVPGFSGQPFLPSTYDRVAQLSSYCSDNNLTITLAVDGGVTRDNCVKLLALGVQHFAIASALFDAPDPVVALQEFQALISGVNIRC